MPNLPLLLRHISVPMRDGVRLATTVHLPEGDGPFPVVLVRTAYNRVPMTGAGFVEHGIAFVAQDVRGRYGSEGEFHPFTAEEDDGYDCLDWIAAQEWCDGRVTMFGDSYLAATQFYAALSQHPALVALNPRFMAGDCWKRAYYCDGVFSLGLTWSWLCFECNARTSEAGLMPQFDVRTVLESLPILEMDVVSGAGEVGSYRDYVRACRYDNGVGTGMSLPQQQTVGGPWEQTNVRARFDRVRVPMFLVGGWYDYYAGETFANYAALMEHSAPEVRGQHRVLVGPWTHGISGVSTLGELDFGPEVVKGNDCTMRWIGAMLAVSAPRGSALQRATASEADDSRALEGAPTNGSANATAFQEAPIRIFVMGGNVWRDEWEWPLARTQWQDWHLRADGGLAVEAPGDEGADEYTYDPANPVQTRGGNHSIGPYNPGLYELAPPGPYDQRGIEAREDVLVYTSEALERDLEATGPVTVTLYAASSAPDTDFVARLCDVYPDGRSIVITEGVVRARFREGVWDEPKLMEPGRVYEFTIDLACTSNVFRAGHRLRLDITSSCFPLWDRNLNTGNDPATDTEMRTARQTILHDREHPSRVRLPVVPRLIP